jgi:opacity protein-like surface antigen
MLGLGVQYDINRQMGIRAEYELFQALGDSNATSEADASMLSIGVVFRFR